MPDHPAVYKCSNIAMCTGLHVEPNIPTIPGSEHVKGDIFHSASYKGRAQLAHRDVLILGCGETAMGKCVLDNVQSTGMALVADQGMAD